ncbi:MAG TPA: glycosyltransferase [Lutibacter sp.]
MPKICHLTSVHPIDDVRIFTKECTSLANNGFDVTLIACGDTAFEDIKNNVKLISLKVLVNNRLQRFFKRSTAIYSKAVEVDAEIYHFHDPELIPIGLKLHRKGKKIIYDSHEDTAVQIKTKKWIPKIFRNLISFVFMKYEVFAIKRFDAVISVTPLIVEKFKKINSETYQITNYPFITNDCEIKSNIKENIAFAGAINHAYMFENVLKALDQTNGTKLILAGEPITEIYLNELKQTKGWGKVEYIGRIPHNQVKELYSHSAIGIACLDYTSNVGFKEGSLGVLKFFEYMNAGMALICTDFKLWDEIIKKYNCGISVNPHNFQEIRDAIQYLVNNPEKAIEMGENGKNAVKTEFNWESQEAILVNLYKNLQCK